MYHSYIATVLPLIVQLAVPFHPVSKHSSTDGPFRSYPALQEMLTFAPNVVLLPSMTAFAICRLPQSVKGDRYKIEDES